MAVTLVENLINPEVMADMISAELEASLRARQFFRIDRTLVGRAGDTITVPTWKYIGAAQDLLENERGEVSQMQTEEVSYTVKKAVKNVSLTDEAVLSGYGDPVGEASRQLRLSIQDKMDDDAIELLRGIDSDKGHVHAVSGSVIGYDDVIDGLYMMEQYKDEQGIKAYLLVSPQGAKGIRKSAEFMDVAGDKRDRTLVSGTVGRFGGCDVVISKKIDEGEAYILTPRCFSVFMKRSTNLEKQREMLYKRTIIGSDMHYVVAIEDYDRVVALRTES